MGLESSCLADAPAIQDDQQSLAPTAEIVGWRKARAGHH